MLKGRGGPGRGQGRHSALKEDQIKALSMSCIDLTIKYIYNEEVPLKDRADVFSRIAVKVMPQDINLGGQADNPLSVVKLVIMNDDKLNKATVAGD
jgi:hypothetical protein